MANVRHPLLKFNFEFWILDRQGLKNSTEVSRLNQAVLQALQRELNKNPPQAPVKGDVSVISKLLNKRHALR